MKVAIPILIMLFFLFGFTNCEKKCGFGEITGEVEFYLIDSFQLQGQDCAINENSILLESESFILYEEIISYDRESYLFELEESALERIAQLEHSVTGRPFALLANGELVLSGYFWPAYSSISCPWYIIDPLMVDYHGGLKLVMGYPGEIPGLFDPDRRLDERMLEIFATDGKLK